MGKYREMYVRVRPKNLGVVEKCGVDRGSSGGAQHFMFARLCTCKKDTEQMIMNNTPEIFECC
jgi:hypothetical protein